LAAVRSNGLNDEPQYKIEIDREKANALSLTVSDVNTTLSAAWGSEFIDQFTDRGRVKKVFIQGSDSSRMVPENFNDWYVRNSLRQMVPFAAFSQGSWIYGSPKLERYNGSPSAEILGEPAPGLSTGSAWTQWKNWPRSCRLASDSIGLGFPMKNGREVPKLEYCMRSR
jgi:multidrug efflux pump